MRVAFTITWRRVLVAVVAAALLGIGFIYSGLFNVAASSGHWQITNWVLHTTMRSSVRTRAAFSTPKDAADASGMISAANHFDQSCAACHGAPGRKPLAVFQAATPHAPNLATIKGKYTDRQLFWILKHGIKFTGMPAWPALERDDEVKRMTAFVRRLPDMSVAEYRRLTQSPIAPGSKPIPAACSACHGMDGLGRGAADIPILAGQDARALAAALVAYRSGARASGVMQNPAAPMSDQEIVLLSRYYAALPGLGRSAGSGSGAAAQVIARGLPAKQLPACASCHAPGKPYPILTGQKPEYLAARLKAWRGDKNVPDANKGYATMPVIARRIPEELIEPIARELAGE